MRAEVLPGEGKNMCGLTLLSIWPKHGTMVLDPDEVRALLIEIRRCDAELVERGFLEKEEE